MERESLFYAYAAGDLSDGERFGNAAVLSLQNESFENLDSFLITFFDLKVDLNGVSDGKFGNVGSLIFLSDRLNPWNFYPPSFIDVLDIQTPQNQWFADSVRGPPVITQVRL